MRRLHYLFRRRLGMSVDDAEALPWWEWRLLVEGLDEEGRAAAGEEPRAAPDGRAEYDRFDSAGFTVRRADLEEG